MKLISLSQGLFTKVDDEDYLWLNQWKWHAHRNRNTAHWYAIRADKGKVIRMHRLIMGITDPKMVCDHIKGDGLDNQKTNLRTATPTQNRRNSRSFSNSSSKYVGVYRKKSRWAAKIRMNKKDYYLGAFINEEDAARAYNTKATSLFGEFAHLNIV